MTVGHNRQIHIRRPKFENEVNNKKTALDRIETAYQYYEKKKKMVSPTPKSSWAGDHSRIGHSRT